MKNNENNRRKPGKQIYRTFRNFLVDKETSADVYPQEKY